MRKLIERLSVIAKGNNKELDNKLANLRKSFKKPKDFDSLLSEIDTTTKTLISVEKIQQELVDDVISTLLTCGDLLQKTRGLEDGVRRQLRMLVNKVKANNNFTLPQVQPLVMDLLNIFKLSKTTSDGNLVTNFDKKIINTLIEGLKGLSKNEIIVPSLNEFNQRIDVAQNDSERLDVCLKSFSEIVTQFGEEYKQTQKLILNINTALEGVHKTLLKSIETSKDYSKQLKELNETIDKQIQELSTDAGSASSIGQLQAIVEQKIGVITESIKERDLIEKRRASEIDSTLQAMESKLTQLEERTEYYRKKWLEEKTRSNTDSLTALPNRGAYNKRFEEEFQRWLRQPDPLCLAVIDIDHFKKINDKYGHNVGDKTLQVVAKTLRTSLRTTDFLSRYGGEEFACLLPNTDPKEAMLPLEKVRKGVESIPFKVKNERLNITISIGYTMLKASDNNHTVFERADKALYEAKDAGRNKICYKK
jgi:diguanylate cyclase (GGDEF)-like protein